MQERAFSQTPLMESSLTLPRASSQVLVRVLLSEGIVRQARADPDSIITPQLPRALDHQLYLVPHGSPPTAGQYHRAVMWDRDRGLQV